MLAKGRRNLLKAMELEEGTREPSGAQLGEGPQPSTRVHSQLQEAQNYKGDYVVAGVVFIV